MLELALVAFPLICRMDAERCQRWTWSATLPTADLVLGGGELISPGTENASARSEGGGKTVQVRLSGLPDSEGANRGSFPGQFPD